MVEGVSTRPTVDFTGLHVTIPAQPVTVAHGIITSYIVSVERYSSGDHQSHIVSAIQNSSSETVTFDGLSKLVCDRKFLSCSDTCSAGTLVFSVGVLLSFSTYSSTNTLQYLSICCQHGWCWRESCIYQFHH